MFIGEYEHSVDKKNRVIIPARFRETITEKGVERLYVTRGLDECLFVHTEDDWKAQEAKFKAMPFTKSEVRKFNRMFFGSAVECVPDGQWRILLPEYLKEYAGLSKDIMIIGVANRFEIWDKKKYADFYKATKDNYEEIAERLITE
ncbi:MAG: division/cell wall cluster transcriptional repressor MraZ [Candidatus Omnitrophica bacterium]|jgi:MraZ protein|nr:division/cell wall cluster transcriptional repressor MraZ [Candidatus Omnitrophota bacterium]MDD4012725.1 division/cell wall cluster transcriptional repressor MraZ [Candidatus Omnitrophota bacterium]